MFFWGKPFSFFLYFFSLSSSLSLFMSRRRTSETRAGSSGIWDVCSKILGMAATLSSTLFSLDKVSNTLDDISDCFVLQLVSIPVKFGEFLKEGIQPIFHVYFDRNHSYHSLQVCSSLLKFFSLERPLQACANSFKFKKFEFKFKYVFLWRKIRLIVFKFCDEFLKVLLTLFEFC